MALSADLLRGYTDTIILKQLSNSDSYGYRISKAVAEQSGGGLEKKPPFPPRFGGWRPPAASAPTGATNKAARGGVTIPSRT